MPRPKRAKVAPSESAQRAAKPTTSPTTRSQSKNPSQEASERNTTTSDDSEGLVTKNPTGLNRRGVPRMEAMMSGALSTEDIDGARLKPIKGRKRIALSRVAREGDHAKAIEALRARRDAEIAAEKAAKEQKETAVDGIESSTEQVDAAQTVPSIEEPRSSVGERTRAPLRRESSVLADFKRRTRKPSMLQKVQTQHQQAQAEGSDDDNNDDDSLNDFQPEDESTPFTKPRPVRAYAHSTPSASAPSILQSSSSRKRKLGSPEPEIQVPASQHSSIAQPSSPPAHAQDADNNPFDIPADEEDAPEPSLPVIRSTPISLPADQPDLAPPQSSSPRPEPISHHRRPRASAPKQSQARALRNPRPTSRPQREYTPPPSPLSSMSSHPSPIRSAQKAPLKPLTTASLQNLLPRRRIRPKDKASHAFDIPTSSDIELSEDQDELSYHKLPKSRAKRTAPTPKAKVGKGAMKSVNGRVSSTYSRKKIIEVPDNDTNDEDERPGEEGAEGEVTMKKENAVYGHSSIAVKGEMRRLAKKFKEVDDWALEIEDVTPHSGSSQMIDAR